MESPADEIVLNLVSANFSRAVTLSEDWLKSLSVDNRNKLIEREAEEAFILSRFLQNRHERISSLKPGADKARTFLEYLDQLQKTAEAEKFDLQRSRFYRAAETYLHGQIADSLARDFAGQQSYNLEHSEIVQLALSLIKIGKFTSASEVLQFLHRINRRNAEVNFLLASVSYHLNRRADFDRFFREALFLKPEIILQYRNLIPPGVYLDLWRELGVEEMSPVIRARNYALLLEVNGLYTYQRDTGEREARHLENEFKKLHLEYTNNIKMRDELLPRILHYLCWLILYMQKSHDYDRLEEYRAVMIDLDEEIWDTFQEKNLNRKK